MRQRRWLRTCLAALGLAVLAAALLASPAGAEETASPEGLWRVLDEATGKPDALVRIYPVNDELQGRLDTIFPAPGDDQDPRCGRCAGERHNQPKRGMVFMWGFVKSDNEYTGGRVLDPDTGSVYRAKMRLSEDGEKLILHGYIGIPLLGRSQTWYRVR